MQRPDKGQCPNCGAHGVQVIYTAKQVPVHSVLLFNTREEAVRYPKGDIELGLCPSCGFLTNVTFDPALHEYSSRYEETQGFSSTFAKFHRHLAESLVDQYNLRNKTIVEIGCGKGEFLSMLCEIGGNRGIGFDPAYIPERNASPAKERIQFITDLYSEKYREYTGDFTCCKMTLEHIPETLSFIQTVRRSVGDRPEATVFFQIPEVLRILHERAFWDIYYEHCSYFSKGSLARLFRRAGFDVLKLWTDYDDQYLMIESRPTVGAGIPPLPEEDDLQATVRATEEFTKGIDRFLEDWRNRLDAMRREGRRVVIWGGGSKGVAFLTKLGIGEEVACAIDINPYKNGTFMAGTGHEIKLPEYLKEYRPQDVIVMNPIYCDEVRADMARLGVTANIIPVTVHDDSRP
jgi:SAM-dependent methyltransferase